MTKNRRFKQRVRARAAKIGTSYTTARMNLQRNGPNSIAPEEKAPLRLAVAQTTACDDPRDVGRLRATGLEMRTLMRQAHRAGARLVHFPEGAICAPNKRIMSINGPRDVGPSDWSRFGWAVLREELDAARQLARELRLWTVIGSAHQLTQPHRPHNSLYVFSGAGELVTRYDERMLSNTKVSFMYSPGSMPVTFEIDGVRFGCALGMEAHFPEIFLEYERADVDCVLFSTTAGSSSFAVEALGHAASNFYWVSLAAHSGTGLASGVASPDGRWATQCAENEAPSIAVFDIRHTVGNPARPWRRTARTGAYAGRLVEGDPRSDNRNFF